jgi:hypothetical protein
MRNPRTRFEHEASYSSYGNMRANAGLIDDNERSVQHIQVALLHKQDGHPVFHRDRFEGRKNRFGHEHLI